MPKCGPSLIHISPYMDRIVSIFSFIGHILRFCLNTERYRHGSIHIRENTDQRKHGVTIKNANFLPLIVSFINEKHFLWPTNVKVFNKKGITSLNVKSFSSCRHDWLVCSCFCTCICLLLRTFRLACYRLCVKHVIACI